MKIFEPAGEFLFIADSACCSWRMRSRMKGENIGGHALRSTKEGTAMGNVRRASLITSLGLVLVLQALSAFASGREGEQYVPAVQFIVYTTVIALAVTTVAGGFIGAIRAKRSDQSVVKGTALGVLRGIGAFVVLAVITTAVLTVLSGMYIVYAFMTVR